jgi:hypothetical protein
MTASVIGLAVGIALGFAGAFGGFGAFAIVAVLGLVGLVVGRVIDGELDLTPFLSGSRNRR